MTIEFRPAATICDKLRSYRQRDFPVHRLNSNHLPPQGRSSGAFPWLLQHLIVAGLLVCVATVAEAGVDVWTTNGPEGGSIFALAIDPTTPATLYAGTTGGLFKSLDAGANWSAVNSGLTNTFVLDLAIDPTTPATLYAGTNGGGVFKSLNAGANWSAVNSVID